MAQDKTSFIAYCNWIKTFDELEDAEAGRLVKHLFRYVNDMQPEAPDKLTKMMFIPMQTILKADLKKWEIYQEKQKNNGLKGGRPKKKETQKTQPFISKPKKADIVIVYDNVNEDENIKKDKSGIPILKYNFKQALLDLGIESKIINEWLLVRKNKKATNSETAFNSLLNQIELSGLSPNECIKISVENSWSGFKNEWLNNKQNGNNTSKNNNGLNRPSEEDFLTAIENGCRNAQE